MSLLEVSATARDARQMPQIEGGRGCVTHEKRRQRQDSRRLSVKRAGRAAAPENAVAETQRIVKCVDGRRQRIVIEDPPTSRLCFCPPFSLPWVLVRFVRLSSFCFAVACGTVEPASWARRWSFRSLWNKLPVASGVSLERSCSGPRPCDFPHPCDSLRARSCQGAMEERSRS